MVLGRFKDAVSDVTETIRRAFRDPECRQLPVAMATPGSAGMPPLTACGRGAEFRFGPVTQAPPTAFTASLQAEPMAFEARLCREDAWATWAAGTVVCRMPVLSQGSCGRLAVPPLPRVGQVRRIEPGGFKAKAWGWREPLSAPKARSLAPALPPPRARRGLETILGLPIAIAGEDLARLPKALTMRFTLQLVKATGENIRNLEILGIYPVPVKGVASLRHDPRTGRILVNLAQEAVGAPRGRFILARRKDDHAYMSCFVEE